MRLRLIGFTVLVIAVLGAVAFAQDTRMDGTCTALDPLLVRPLLREELCALACLEPIPGDAAVEEATIVLRRAPLADREEAARELLFDVSITDTAEAAGRIPGIAERHGVDEAALRDVAGLARERLLMRLRDEGMIDEANAACLLQRLYLYFGDLEPASSP